VLFRSIADALRSDVALLRVTSSRAPLPESLTPSGQDVAMLDTAAEQERAEAETYLQTIYIARPNQRLFFDVVTTSGDIADALVTYADVHDVDLIVMSSHGRHGSVAEKVLRGAGCATLIIRSPRG